MGTAGVLESRQERSTDARLPVPSKDVLLPLAAGVVAALMVLPLLSYYFVWDQCVFAVLADSMRRGGVAYRDAWEHKPPGISVVYWLAFSVFGHDYWSIRVLEILSIAASSAGLMHLARSRFGTIAGGWVAAIGFPAVYLVLGGNTAQPETFQIPFVVWGLAIWPEREDTECLGVRCFMTGVLLSVVVLLKTPMVTFPALVLADRILADRHRAGWGGKTTLTAITAAGVAAPLFLITAYYLARGAGTEFLDALVIFPAKYAAYCSDRSALGALRHFLGWPQWFLPLAPGVLLALGIVRGALVRPRATLRWGCTFAAAWVSIALQGKYFDYHHLPIVPFLALGFALPFAEPRDPLLAERTRRLWARAAWVLVALGMVQYSPFLFAAWRGFPALARLDVPTGELPEAVGEGGEREVAQWIRSVCGPDERMFVWGNKPILYFLADRPMAGPYCHMLGMIPPWPEPARLSRLIRRLDVEKPKVIVVCSSDQCWWQSQDAKTLLTESLEMKALVSDVYRLVRRVGR